MRGGRNSVRENVTRIPNEHEHESSNTDPRAKPMGLFQSCLNLKAVLAIPLLGAGMERDVARGGFGVFTELADSRVGVLPIDLVLAGRERLADFVGVVIGQ